MMPQAEQYPYVARNPASGAVGFLPFLPITLTLGQRNLQVTGLLDTASTVNVLPFDLGEQLGGRLGQTDCADSVDGKPGERGSKRSAVVGNRRQVSLGSARIRMDEKQCGSGIARAGEFLHGVRRLLLSLPPCF